MSRPDAVGIVGLGVMGLGIAKRLIQRDVDVVGFDISDERLAELTDLGGRTGRSAGEVLVGATTVLTCLPSAEALGDVVTGAGGFTSVDGDARLIVETSTLSLVAKTSARSQLEAQGHVVLDAPISGTEAQLHSGDAILYASGGTTAEMDTLRTSLEGVFSEIVDLGQFGSGTKIKLIANHLVAVHNLAAAEAMLLADLAGMDLATVLQALTAGAGSSRMLEVRGPLMVHGRYEPAQMRFQLFDKDLGLIREFADSVGAPIGLFDEARTRYSEALAAGYGHSDTARLFQLLQESARSEGRT